MGPQLKYVNSFRLLVIITVHVALYSFQGTLLGEYLFEVVRYETDRRSTAQRTAVMKLKLKNGYPPACD